METNERKYGGMNNERYCQHGRHERSCYICYMEEEIVELTERHARELRSVAEAVLERSAVIGARKAEACRLPDGQAVADAVRSIHLPSLIANVTGKAESFYSGQLGVPADGQPQPSGERTAPIPTWMQHTIADIAHLAGINGESLAILAHALGREELTLVQKLTIPLSEQWPHVIASQGAEPVGYIDPSDLHRMGRCAMTEFEQVRLSLRRALDHIPRNVRKYVEDAAALLERTEVARVAAEENYQAAALRANANAEMFKLLQFENKQLRAQLAEAQKDAERYRWLRNPTVDVGFVLDKCVGHLESGHGIYEYKAGEELDNAIDAARSTSQQPQWSHPDGFGGGLMGEI
jgi:hypothetical protein